MNATFASFLVASLVAANSGRTAGEPTAAIEERNSDSNVAQADDTFVLSVPNPLLTLRRGEVKGIYVAIKRGRGFQGDVFIRLEDVPAGVRLEPIAQQIRSDQNSAKVTLHAGNNAALGDYTVTVIGRPATGADAVSQFRLIIQR